jgi:NADPH-dependent 2,4-dienoyl-CoA reductase/sulfur reductase-like enzyme
MSALFIVRNVDVLIIGAGPAGLSAATRLRHLGVADVIVVEREPTGGGIPRHCGHPPFGMREFGLVMTGPVYARRLVERAIECGVELQLGCSVVSIDRVDGLVVTCASSLGPITFLAKRIIIATGIRERPRSARLVSGDRPLGILNTGALQEYVYLQKLAPFRRPLIVGTELVALSSLLTCRKIGAKPVAMVESRDRPTARPLAMMLPRLLGIPVRYGTHIIDIAGRERVEHVTLIRPDGTKEDVACDGVLFTGSFKPEVALARAANVDIDPATGGPVIDQFARTSDPRIFAAGNVLRPVETAGWSWAEGRRVAEFVARDLERKLPSSDDPVKIMPGAGIRYVVPQRLTRGGGGFGQLQLRATKEISGSLVAFSGDRIIRKQQMISAPERRILLPLSEFSKADADITIGMETARSKEFRSDAECV